jgi:hypothetical protein
MAAISIQSPVSASNSLLMAELALSKWLPSTTKCISRGMVFIAQIGGFIEAARNKLTL